MSDVSQEAAGFVESARRLATGIDRLVAERDALLDAIEEIAQDRCEATGAKLARKFQSRAQIALKRARELRQR